MAQDIVKCQSQDSSPHVLPSTVNLAHLRHLDTDMLPSFKSVHLIKPQEPLQFYLSSVPGRDDAHVSWIFNGNDGPGSQKQLFPCFLQINDVYP